MAKILKYDGLSTSELSQLTRDRGLTKPDVLNAGEWAAWLREQDNPTPKVKAEAKTPAQKSAPADNPEDTDAEDTDLESMTVPELKAYAAKNDIDLAGATRREDIIGAIMDAEGNG